MRKLRLVVLSVLTVLGLSVLTGCHQPTYEVCNKYRPHFQDQLIAYSWGRDPERSTNDHYRCAALHPTTRHVHEYCVYEFAGFNPWYDCSW